MATSAFRSTTKRSTLPSPHRRSRQPTVPADISPSISGFEEISLDDLADEMFHTNEVDGRPGMGRSRRRDEELGYLQETGSSRRRGRSVSRSREPPEAEKVGRGRRRSASVARDRGRGSKVMVKVEPTITIHGDDSHSTSSNDIKTISEIRRSYTSKLEQSEKRRQELMAKLSAEEQRGQELTKIVKKLPHAPKNTAKAGRPSGFTRRRKDKAQSSENLNEEAEKIFEDFLSSIDDTDISSYDGERSDTSSTFGGSATVRYPVTHDGMSANAAASSIKEDGVVLPWLQWETKFPSPIKPKFPSGNNLLDTPRESGAVSYRSNCLASSRGSWSPEAYDSCSAISPAVTSIQAGEAESIIISRPVSRQNVSYFDMDEYAELQLKEEMLFEMLRQRQRIETGSLLLCGRILI